MKFFLTITTFFIVTNISAQKVFSVEYESQADIKVFVVDYESQADLSVFKVDYSSQAGKNNGKWFFVEYASQADKKICKADGNAVDPDLCSAIDNDTTKECKCGS